MPTQKLPRYPFRKQKPAPELSTEDLHKLFDGVESAAGAGLPVAEVPKAFRERQRAVAGRMPDPADTTVPRWLYARIERGAKPEQIADDVLARLRRAPSERALRQSAAMLEELARRRGGAKLLTEVVSQELVRELEVKEN